MKKEVLICIGYFLITTALIVYLFMNREIVIKYPPIKTSETKITMRYYVFELPRHEIDMLSSYYDKDSSLHQIYKDTVKIKRDSFEVSWITLADVNSDMQKAFFNYDSIKVRYFDKVVTNTIVDTLLTERIKELPFYFDNWFWYSVTVTLLFFTSLFAIIFG